MNDVSGSSEVKKRKGPSAEYQRARRADIAAGKWIVKRHTRPEKDAVDTQPSTEPVASIVGDSGVI